MKLPARIRGWFRHRKLDAEMAEEMRLHVEQRTRENIAAGLSRAEASNAALRRFGNVERAKDNARDGRSFRWLAHCAQDLRDATR